MTSLLNKMKARFFGMNYQNRLIFSELPESLTKGSTLTEFPHVFHFPAIGMNSCLELENIAKKIQLARQVDYHKKSKPTQFPVTAPVYSELLGMAVTDAIQLARDLTGAKPGEDFDFPLSKKQIDKLWAHRYPYNASCYEPTSNSKVEAVVRSYFLTTLNPEKDSCSTEKKDTTEEYLLLSATV